MGPRKDERLLHSPCRLSALRWIVELLIGRRDVLAVPPRRAQQGVCGAAWRGDNAVSRLRGCDRVDMDLEMSLAACRAHGRAPTPSEPLSLPSTYSDGSSPPGAACPRPRSKNNLLLLL